MCVSSDALGPREGDCCSHACRLKGIATDETCQDDKMKKSGQ